MMKQKVLAGIDIGTSKVTTIIATSPPDGLVNVMGVATVESKGLRKGQVVDIEDATSSIVESLEAAERMAGYSISGAYLTVGGAHITSQNSHGVVAVAEPQKEINRVDIRRAIDAAKAVQLPSTREILHVLPREFIVDSQEGIKDPVGMTGVRLEVNTHLITAGMTALRNLEKCASLVGVDVEGFVFGGLASSISVLTETEKELGVILVDIGGGTIDISIYVEGALSYSSVLPIGAKNITNDLAIGLRVSLESAEKIKLALSREPKVLTLPEEQPHEKDKRGKSVPDDIDFSELSLPEGVKKVSRKTLIDGIIKPRLNEIFTMVGLELKKSGFAGMTPAGLVICGGGALTTGIIETAKRNLAMPVRIGVPGNISGLIDEIQSPLYASAVGLLLYGAQDQKDQNTSPALKNFSELTQKLPIKGVAGKIVDMVKSFLP